MMENPVPTLFGTLHTILADVKQYFESVDNTIRQMAKDQFAIPRPDEYDYQVERRRNTLSSYDSSFNNPYDNYWDLLPREIQDTGLTLEKQVLAFANAFAGQVKSSLLANESDQHDIIFTVKEMCAALKLREFFQWDTRRIHDEGGNVIGTEPSGQKYGATLRAIEAQRRFILLADNLFSIGKIIEAGNAFSQRQNTSEEQSVSRYRHNTAFIIMSMNKDKPELEDILQGIKDVFAEFKIVAARADDIEHSDRITDLVLQEIETAEFLIADLTDERPNVYYEVGYAHALHKHVILYRKRGTTLHFDLANYNCPDYGNVVELKSLLRKRLETITNKRY